VIETLPDLGGSGQARASSKLVGAAVQTQCSSFATTPHYCTRISEAPVNWWDLFEERSGRQGGTVWAVSWQAEIRIAFFLSSGRILGLNEGA
jgi:hypothetical protein